MQQVQANLIPCIRLYNIEDNKCTFEKGNLPAAASIAASYFVIQSHIDDYQTRPHPAPRKQYVITLKGKLRFRVSNGETFTIEPGVILLAEDTEGPGHSWELIEGEEWLRVYIPVPTSEKDAFIAESK
ncbi:cupin domain-containing protein [Flavobacterium rhizosphaerae]|uniref:Cupin domain-containing protein n=1 Tax=Flavobacterium rhizosphaerae TaxID=3163298 RepID=A0ABW8Z2U1_9FLAO